MRLVASQVTRQGARSFLVVQAICVEADAPPDWAAGAADSLAGKWAGSCARERSGWRGDIGCRKEEVYG